MPKAAVVTFVLLGVLGWQGESFCTLGADQYEVATETEKEEKPKKVEEVLRPVVEFESEGARDPFILYEEEKKTVKTLDSVEVVNLPADFLVQGLIWGGRLNQAIIKNKVVKVGDTLDEAKILDIGKNGVAVFYKGRKFELPSPATIKMEKFKKAGGEDEKGS
jgi:hypothetical protein